jgi:hypothetical protein
MSTTLSTLRARTRRYLDETSADRWTDSQLNSYINEGIRFCQSELHRANPEYFLRVCTFTASAGSYEAAFPSTIYGRTIRNMQCYVNSTVATGLPIRVQPGQLEYVLSRLNFSGSPEVYTPLAGYMMWCPMLNYASTFRFVYAKKEADLSSDSDTLDAISDEYTDIISMYAAALALESKNIPSGGVRSMIAQRVMNMQNDSQPTDTLIIPQRDIDG